MLPCLPTWDPRTDAHQTGSQIAVHRQTPSLTDVRDSQEMTLFQIQQPCQKVTYIDSPLMHPAYCCRGQTGSAYALQWPVS